MLKVEGTRTIRLTNFFLLLAERYNFKNLISDPIELFKSSNISTGLSSVITDNNKIIYEAPNTSNYNKFERFKNWINSHVRNLDQSLDDIPSTGWDWVDWIISEFLNPIIQKIKYYIGDIHNTINELSYEVKHSGDLVVKGGNSSFNYDYKYNLQILY